MDNSNNMLQLCRLCLVKDNVNIPIFEEQGDIRQIFAKISSCLPVKVSRDDKLPKKICDGCSHKLEVVYDFWNTSVNAEKQFLAWLGEAEANLKVADGTVAAVAQQIKQVETFVKQEAIDPSDIHTEVNDDDKSYMFQQKFEEAGPSATVTSNEEPPPPKRARRTAAVKAAIAMDPESDDDEDSGEPMTKVEDESEESEGEDHEPAYVDVPSTSADDQPGPSGVGKDGVEAPCSSEIDVQCHLCNETFDGSNKLQIHLENLEAFLKAFCKNCKNFVRFEDSVLHFDVTYSCTLCKLILPKQNFLDHKCLHKSSSQHVAMKMRQECGVCEKLFFSDQDIDSHIKEKHSSMLTNFCRCCNISFKRMTSYLKHISEHTTNISVPLQIQSYRCPVCDVEFQQKKSLSIHTRMVHRTKESDKKSKPKKSLRNNSSNFISSILKITSAKNRSLYTCNICNKNCKSAHTLTSHRRTHITKTLGSSICPKSVKTRAS